MSRASVEDTSAWVRTFRPAPADRPTVVCLPHAGGAATLFREFVTALPEQVRAVAVQYPARQDRLHEPGIDDLHDLADLVTDVLLRVLDGGPPVPLVLFGHSMGALLAYEVAVRMRDGGHRPPEALVLSGRRAPSCPDDTRNHLLDDDRLARVLVDGGGTSSELLEDPEMRAMVLATVRCDYRAVERYAPRDVEPLSCPLHVLTGSQDPRTSDALVRPWELCTTGTTTWHAFPGDHFFVQRCWPAVAAITVDALAGVPTDAR